jgi:hypothetical protein
VALFSTLDERKPRWIQFPVDAKQVHYLWTEGYIELPKITREEIRDKNKVDGVLRIFTIFQIVWFIVDMAGRRAQNLAITCGELTTVAFIVCSFGTVLCWIYKPADVTTSVIIETNASIDGIAIKLEIELQNPTELQGLGKEFAGS